MAAGEDIMVTLDIEQVDPPLLAGGRIDVPSGRIAGGSRDVGVGSPADAPATEGRGNPPGSILQDPRFGC